MKTCGGGTMKVMNLLVIFSIAILLCGCGAGKTLVMEPGENKYSASSVSIVQDQCTVNVPNEVLEEFREKLSLKIYNKGKFKEGNELEIKYRFLQFDPGNQFTRWFWGGIGNTGEGTLTVETKYFDSKGNLVSQIQSEGKIGSGFFGGDFSLAVDRAAEEISEYTILNFM